MARIFIGVPTLNRPDLALETIESLRRQSFTDFRVVVSDDVSRPEASRDLAQSLARLHDDRFVFHRQSTRQGEYGQGRFFLGAAQGDDLFMILHDDDVLHPDCLEVAVAALDHSPEAAFFVPGMDVIDEDGAPLEDETARYRSRLGRIGATEGLFDVLSKHVLVGFAPISGTLFRRGALLASGFVDPDLFGNYPFECNLFLRLGEYRATAWHCPRTLMSVRFHPGALRNQHEMDNPHIVRSVIRLWERRRYEGAVERRRRVLLSRFLRADALIRARQGDHLGARRSLARALRENPGSFRGWACAPLMLMSQRGVSRLLGPVSELQNPPIYDANLSNSTVSGGP